MLNRTILPDIDLLKEDIADAFLYKATGKLVYDPPRCGMKNKTTWWAVVEVDKEITRYYRSWIKTVYGIDLCVPSWDAHISVIRGEKPTDKLMHLWKKYDGSIIEFEYRHFPRFNGDTRSVKSSKPGSFWFVDVISPTIKQIRDELELPSFWNQHITVGRKW